MLKQVISTTSLRVAGILLMFIMHIYFSRSFGAETYGLLSFTIASASLLRLFSLHGWPSGILKLVAVYNEQKQWGLFKGVLFNSFWHSISLSIVISTVLLLLVYFGYFDNNLSAGLFYTALMLPVLTATSIRKRLFQALNKPVGSIIPDEIFLPLLVCLIIFLISINQKYAVFIYISAATIVMLLAVFWLWSIIPTEVKTAPVERMTKNWLGIILPMLFGSIGQFLLNRTDIIMIGGLLPIENAGIYSAAFRISLLTTFILGSINILITPKLASSFHAEDKKSLIIIENNL